MIRTVLFIAAAVLFIFLSLFFVLLPYYIFRLAMLRKAADWWMKQSATVYGRALVLGTGAKVEVNGLEYFPRNNRHLCVVANHQSLFDIPLLVGYLPALLGFIAKKELGRVPVLNLWMKALGSVLIDRRNRRSAIEAIKTGVQRIQNGRPLAVFPEGTRSRSGEMGRFKPGSLKLALRANAVIVPVTIEGSHRIFEGAGGIHPSKIAITVHEPVATEGMSEEEQKKLTDSLEATIRSGMQREHET